MSEAEEDAKVALAKALQEVAALKARLYEIEQTTARAESLRNPPAVPMARGGTDHMARVAKLPREVVDRMSQACDTATIQSIVRDNRGGW
jgi:hypothetical protein